MKSPKISSIIRLGAIIALFSLIHGTVNSMKMKLTPERKQLVAKKIALSLQKINPSIWVQTSDNEISSIYQWKIDQIDTLKALLSAQQGPNSQTNPLKAPMITKTDLTLLSKALDNVAAGTFDQYYQSLVPEYNKSLIDKNVGAGTLRTLIAAAGKVKATTLSALLSSYFLPNDMLRAEMIPHIANPIAQFLKSKIAEQDTLYSTILVGHPDAITNCEFSKDGSILVTSSKGATNNLIIWNGQTGAQLKTISTSGENGDIEIVKPSPDGSKVVILTTKKMDETKDKNEPNSEKQGA